MNRNGELLLVLIYVDDVLIANREISDLNDIKHGLMKKFEIKDLGTAQYCLGIEISRRKERITTSQAGYIQDILGRFGMEKSKPTLTPIDLSQKLKIVGYENHINRPYQELIGALNYLSVTTRSDIFYVVSPLSQFNTCHGGQHWIAAKRVLRYLKRTIDHGIVYSKSSNCGSRSYRWRQE